MNNTITADSGSAVKLHWPEEGAEISDTVFERNTVGRGLGGAVAVLETQSGKIGVPPSMAFRKGSTVVRILQSTFFANTVLFCTPFICCVKPRL